MKKKELKWDNITAAAEIKTLAREIVTNDGKSNTLRVQAGRILSDQHDILGKEWTKWLLNTNVCVQEARRWVRMAKWVGQDEDRASRIEVATYAEALRMISPAKPAKAKEKAQLEWMDDTINGHAGKCLWVSVRHGSGLSSINTSDTRKKLEQQLDSRGEVWICLRRGKPAQKEAPLAASWMDTAPLRPKHQTLKKEKAKRVDLLPLQLHQQTPSEKQAGVLRAVAALTTGASL